tara:strand:- start:195 stop:395 length:201 start_codon:yes stop_codon:yes gene_type:complete
LFNELFSNKELCPQSCINENVLEDKSVRSTRMGIKKKNFVISNKGELIILETNHQRKMMGDKVEII